MNILSNAKLLPKKLMNYKMCNTTDVTLRKKSNMPAYPRIRRHSQNANRFLRPKLDRQAYDYINSVTN